METIYDAGHRVFEAARWDTLQVGNTDDCIEMFEAGVEFAQRWIPIEEELPEKLVQVIVKFENGWCTCTWITEDGDFAFNVKPTHWRPIELK